MWRRKIQDPCFPGFHFIASGLRLLTRPFGATMGDLLTKTPSQGGLGFGTIGSSAVLMSILFVLIYWSMRDGHTRAARR